MSRFMIRAGLVLATGGLAVVAVTAMAPVAAVAHTPATAAVSAAPPTTTPSTSPSGGGLTVGVGGITVAVGAGTVAVGPVSVSVPGTVAGVGTTVTKTVGGLTNGSGATGTTPPSSGGQTSSPPPGHGSSTPTKHPNPVGPPTHPAQGSTPRTRTSHAASAGTVNRTTVQSARTEPRDTVRTPSLQGQSRLDRPLAAKHHITILDRALGKVERPGQAVLMLLASTAILAILVLSLLVFVGRRPDPRVAESARRLRNAITW